MTSEPHLCLAKGQKSHGERSGEYGGWVVVGILFFANSALEGRFDEVDGHCGGPSCFSIADCGTQICLNLLQVAP
jgi:hypothetical protein